MKKFKFLLVVLVLYGCSLDKEEFSSREYITTCYKFVEEESGIPISNLKILIHYGYDNLLSSQGITNEDGTLCFQHWNDIGDWASLYTPLIEDRFFKTPEKLPLNGRINTIELIPKSRIKFHIVNVEPSSNSDRVDVSTFIKIDEIYSYGESRPFQGKDIDIFWNVSALKGSNNYIKWVVRESDIIVGTYRDTITINEHHDVVDYLIEY